MIIHYLGISSHSIARPRRSGNGCVGFMGSNIKITARIFHTACHSRYAWPGIPARLVAIQ